VAAQPTIRPGTIILAQVNDPTGKPAREHFAVVLNSQAEIEAGEDLRVAVCTTSFETPLRSGWFAIPTKPGGHAITGLGEACVVKATWLQVVPQANVIKVRGRAPAAIVRQIRNWLADKERAVKGDKNKPAE